MPENTFPKRYRYGPYEGYETRSQRRLQNDLDFGTAGTEAILGLRSQVIELQSHIRQLEAELAEKKCQPTVASGLLPGSFFRSYLDRTVNSGMMLLESKE